MPWTGATPTVLTSQFNQTNAATLLLPPSGSVNLVAGRLYLYLFSCHRSTAAPDLSTGFTFTHSGTAKTWTFIKQSATFDSGLRRIAAYWYIPAANETGITITFGSGGTNSHNAAHLIEITSGFNPTTPIRDSGEATAAAALSLFVDLSAGPDDGDLCVSAFATGTTTTNALTPRTNWTELGEVQGTGTSSDAGSNEVQFIATPELSASASVASTTRVWGGVHLLIAAAAAVSTPQIIGQAVGRASLH